MREYSVNEFIELTKSEPYNWIQYCEIMIKHNGMIILARPSHQECMIQYAMEMEGKTRDEITEELRKDYVSPLGYYIDKYHMIAVWYDYLLLSDAQKLNRFQTRTLSILGEAGLIKIRDTGFTNEYRMSLNRKGLC